MAGTSRISGAVASKARAVEPEGQAAGGEVFGEGRGRLGNRLGPFRVPLGQAEVTVAGLEQSQLRHDGLTPFLARPAPGSGSRASGLDFDGEKAVVPSLLRSLL